MIDSNNVQLYLLLDIKVNSHTGAILLLTKFNGTASVQNDHQYLMQKFAEKCQHMGSE